MKRRQPLLNQSGHLGDAFKFLTDAQLAKFAQWSIIKERGVLPLLRDAAFVAEHDGKPGTVTLTGMLPGCNLYGAVLPDGSTHT